MMMNEFMITLKPKSHAARPRLPRSRSSCWNCGRFDDCSIPAKRHNSTYIGERYSCWCPCVESEDGDNQ